MEAQLRCLRSDATQMRTVEAAEQTDFAEVHYLGAALRTIVENLQCRPLLRSQTVSIDSYAKLIGAGHLQRQFIEY